MPHNLNPSEPTLVMPIGLMTAFEEVLFLDAQLNEYPDGRSTRRALAINPRHTFRVSRALTNYELDDLRGFYFAFARYGYAFWFYNLRETVPPFDWDATGGDPVGRYTVVWEGPWSDKIGIKLNGSDFVLREVG